MKSELDITMSISNKVMISKASKIIAESTNGDVGKLHEFDKVPTVLPNLSQFLKWVLVCCHINHAASHQIHTVVCQPVG